MLTKDMHFNKIHLHTKTSESLRLGIILAIVGGFLDAYTFIERGGVFANAQSGNLVLFGIALSKGNLNEAFTAFLPILAFIFGVLFTEKIKTINFPLKSFEANKERIILIIEIIVLFLVGFMPKSIPDTFITVPIAFVSSVQIASFGRLIDSPYSTTMCTGNLRSALQAGFKAYTQKDKSSAFKSLRYLTIIIFFIIGGFISGILTSKIGIKSIWFSVIMLIIAFILFNIDEHILKRNQK